MSPASESPRAIAVIDRSDAVAELAARIAARDSYIVSVPPDRLEDAVQSLHRLAEWTAYLDHGSDIIARVDGKVAMVMALMTTELLSISGAMIAVVPKTVPFADIASCLGQDFRNSDGSQDLVNIMGTDGRMGWPTLFVDAIEIVDPSFAHAIRAAETAPPTKDPVSDAYCALDNALGALPPHDRDAVVASIKSHIEATAAALAQLPANERAEAVAELAAEGERIVTDIAASGEVGRWARETARLGAARAKRPPFIDPTAAQRVSDAVQVAAKHNKAFRACRHILAGGPVIGRGGALLCINHPQLGAYCEGCFATHVATHDPVAERTCDRCDREVESIWPAYHFGPTAFEVVDLSRRRRYVPAALFVVGIGYCDECKGAIATDGAAR